MNIINNDEFVAPLKAGNLALIEQVKHFLSEQYQGGYEQDVHLFETIHGHIVMFKRKRGHCFKDDQPMRLDNSDLKYFGSIADDIRWVELGMRNISIGLLRE